MFCPNLYQQLKSAHISESIIGMKIGPFLCYIKWVGEPGSVGCVFIACSLLFVRLIPGEAIFSKIVLGTAELFAEIAETCREIDAMEDVYAPAWYRQHLAVVLTRRALARAFSRAENGTEMTLR